jgi:hypothetical protein
MTAINDTSMLWTTRLLSVLQARDAASDTDADRERPGPDCCWLLCDICCWVRC